MAYTKFETGVPVITDPGGDQITDARNNLEALRDAIATGSLVDWDMSQTIGSGTEDEPQYLIWTNGTEGIRATITWGTTGGSDGNPTQIIYEYSATATFPGDTIGTWAGTYSTGGTLTSTTWT